MLRVGRGAGECVFAVKWRAANAGTGLKQFREM
jgi:hypothetical protein